LYGACLLDDNERRLKLGAVLMKIDDWGSNRAETERTAIATTEAKSLEENFIVGERLRCNGEMECFLVLGPPSN
jgi:hypothetical protein